MLDIGTGTVTVSRDIHTVHPVTTTGLFSPLMSRTGTIKAEASVVGEDDGRGNKDFVLKTDNTTDNLFIEDVSTYTRARARSWFGS